MTNRTETTRHAIYWRTLMTVFLIAITPAWSLSRTAATVAASLAPAEQTSDQTPAQSGGQASTRSEELAEAKRLNNEAMKLYQAGRYAEAIPLAERVLAIVEKLLGSNHSSVPALLNNLGAIYKENGDYAKAEAAHLRALAIREKALGPDHPDVAQSLNNLAALYDDKGDYARAEPLYLRALTIQQKALGPDSPDMANTLNNLAFLYYSKGDYAKAEPLYQQALAIREKALGPEHPDVAQSLNNLAVLYRAKSDYAQAERFGLRALAIKEKALGPDHPSVATSLNNLAELYNAQRDYAKAEPLYQRALAIREKVLGPDHPNVAASLNNLAELYMVTKNYAKAEPLYQRALAIQEKAVGANHPDIASFLNNFALLYRAEGNYAKAEQLHQRALTIRQKALGPNHPDVVDSMNDLVALYAAKGEVAKAVALCRRAADIIERNIELNIAPGSERQKQLYLASFARETDMTVSLHVQFAPNDKAALRLALTTVLRRKGRALDAMADNFAALYRRSDSRDRALLDQFSETRSQLAGRVLNGPGETDPAQYQAEIQRLQDQAEQLESQISARSAEFRAQSQPVTLEAVQAIIPSGASLLEFLSYYPYTPKLNSWGARRYVVYALGNQGEPAWVDLGTAADIDKLVNDLRAVLRLEGNKPLSDIERDVKPKARALDQKILEPVRKLIGNNRTLLISPDGALNLIPFAALVDEQGKYLIESYSITYLTTGRDLLRLQTKTVNRQGAEVFANPDFGADQAAASSRDLKIKQTANNSANGNVAVATADVGPQNASKAVDFSQVSFPPLPGTADEARTLKTLFPDATVWTQAQATKARLKQVNAPSILHIATHGFFLNDAVVGAAEAESRGLFVRANSQGSIAAPEFHIEDPLLRSGLALAGANLHGGDDGILTAREASGLNLWGTKLVVLSACDTGVGEVKNGDGVYGLRRALVLAGSETQVMSLWPVSDIGTRDLMIAYYKELQAGQGRGEALRQVQLRMLKSEDRKHPYYWASFIQSGEWANLDGKR